MSAFGRRHLAASAMYAYRSLVLCIFITTVLRIAVREAGWINWLIVLLVLSVPLAAERAYGRREQGQD